VGDHSYDGACASTTGGARPAPSSWAGPPKRLKLPGAFRAGASRARTTGSGEPGFDDSSLGSRPTKPTTTNQVQPLDLAGGSPADEYGVPGGVRAFNLVPRPLRRARERQSASKGRHRYHVLGRRQVAGGPSRAARRNPRPERLRRAPSGGVAADEPGRSRSRSPPTPPGTRTGPTSSRCSSRGWGPHDGRRPPAQPGRSSRAGAESRRSLDRLGSPALRLHARRREGRTIAARRAARPRRPPSLPKPSGGDRLGACTARPPFRLPDGTSGLHGEVGRVGGAGLRRLGLGGFAGRFPRRWRSGRTARSAGLAERRFDLKTPPLHPSSGLRESSYPPASQPAKRPTSTACLIAPRRARGFRTRAS